MAVSFGCVERGGVEGRSGDKKDKYLRWRSRLDNHPGRSCLG